MLGNDSFFLALLANGGVVGRGQYELSRVSEMFRPVAERLLAVPPEGRQRVWDDFLAGRLRPSPIIEAAPELEPLAATSSQEPKVLASADVATPLDPPQPMPANKRGNAPEPERRVRLTCAVNLAPREVEWLWAGRVPLGMITMFAGDPKLGKSYGTLAMAAAVSRGLPLPMSDVPSRAGSTILKEPPRMIRPDHRPGSSRRVLTLRRFISWSRSSSRMVRRRSPACGLTSTPSRPPPRGWATAV